VPYGELRGDDKLSPSPSIPNRSRQWRSYRGFKRFIELGPRTPGGPEPGHKKINKKISVHHPESQGSSRRIECYHESGNYVSVFPRRGHGVHDIFDSSRELGNQRTQLLKAQAAEDIFHVSG